MNASPNFSSVLDQPTEAIEKPKPLPAGSYITAIQGMPRQDKSTKKGTDYVEFTHKILQALDDVDQEDLATVGGITDKVITNTFYLTEKSAYRLKEFLIDSLLIEDAGSMRPMLEEAVGKQCVVKIKHVASNDGKSTYANIDSTAPIK